MNFAQSILGKAPDQLTYEDLEQYFKNPRQESNLVEYKSYNSKGGTFKKQIANLFPVICAMLNSEGGLVIWGAPEGQKVKGNKEKEFSGLLSPITIKIEKDNLINRISDNITPVPNRINAVVLERDGNYVVLLEVAKSVYAPHQTKDTYYMRLDGQSRPAPHRYVEALFKQERIPELGGYIKFGEMFLNERTYSIPFTIYVLNHTPANNEEKVFFELNIENAPLDESCLASEAKVIFYTNALVCENFAEVLPYGAQPYCHCGIKYFHYSEIVQNPIKKISLKFGGKKSPLKKSEYTLHLTDENITEAKSNPNHIVQEFKEN